MDLGPRLRVHSFGALAAKSGEQCGLELHGYGWANARLHPDFGLWSSEYETGHGPTTNGDDMSRRTRYVLALVLVFAACKKDNPKPDTADRESTAGTAAQPVAVANAADANTPPPKADEPRTEPEPSPTRQSLELLATRGTGEIKSIRQERKGIYQLFMATPEDLQGDVSKLITEAQRLQWDERPEKLKAAPAQIHGIIQQILPVSEKIREVGETGLNTVKTMNEENKAAGKIKHKEDKIDKLQRKSSEEVKVARNLMLLVRSFLDEARVYAEFGALEMREEMRTLFSPLKTATGWSHEQAQRSLDRVLYELNVPGVALPTLD